MVFDLEYTEKGGSFEPDFSEKLDYYGLEYADVFKGRDGFSPTVDVEKVGKVTTITITDKNGQHVSSIEDGSVENVPIDNDTIVLKNGLLAVNTVNIAEADNSKPISSAGVQMIVGNIDVLLRGI